MTLARNALQAALYARLASQLAPTPVYDHVPQGSAYPYVRIGALTAAPWDTKSNDGQEFTVLVHAFAKSAGKKDVQAILEAAYAALHHQESDLTVTGHQVVLLRCEFSEADAEPQGEADTDHHQHGVLRFRTLVRTA